MNVEDDDSRQVYNIKKGRMQKVFLILFVGALGIFIGFRTMKTPTITNDLLLENVEALAEYENSLPIICDGSGSFSCPLNGEKYGYVYKGYSLR